MEALGVYADIQAPETLKPPQQYAADYLVCICKHAEWMVLTRISYAYETLFSPRPNWLPPESVDQRQPLHVEGQTFP